MKFTKKQKEKLINKGWMILDDNSARKSVAGNAFYDLEKMGQHKFQYGLIDESGSFNPKNTSKLSEALKNT
tara:strand:+ start:41390 stop:41602 length:213 start_codon:yes stop_codon:yes gene_type:complete